MSERPTLFPRPFFPALGWPNQELIIAFAVIGLFAFAFAQDPADETMKGALIAGFAGAWGFFLGSSNGARRANDRADVAADTANVLAYKAPTADQPPADAQTASDKRDEFKTNWTEK